MQRDQSFFSQEKHQERVMMDMNNVAIEDSFFFSGELAQKLLMMRELVKDAAKFDKKQYEDVYAYGYNFFAAGQYEKAKEIFKMLLLADHENIKGYLALGSCLQKLKENTKAIHVYTNAHLIEPKNATIYLNLGLCYVNASDHQSAEQAFLYACVMALQETAGDSQGIAQMAEKLWKMARSKQGKEDIALAQSLIQVD